MTPLWYQEYQKLTDFTALHPEIEIGSSKIAIPGAARAEFYQLFNDARLAFIREKYPVMLAESVALSSAYTGVENELTGLLGLSEISIEPGLNRFLHQPDAGLTSALFDPLFDLLKGNMDAEAFEKKGAEEVLVAFERLYGAGYLKWVMLSLMKLVRPEALLRVSLPKVSSAAAAIRLGRALKQVPAPAKSRLLLFDEYVPVNFFTTPDAIMRSKLLNRYVSFLLNVKESIGKASAADEREDWLPFESRLCQESNLVLIHTADQPEDIALIADASGICRPDLAVVVRWQDNWYMKDRLDGIQLCHDALRPALGTYVVSRGSVPEDASAAPPGGINILSAGFDTDKLATVTRALTEAGCAAT